VPAALVNDKDKPARFRGHSHGPGQGRSALNWEDSVTDGNSRPVFVPNNAIGERHRTIDAAHHGGAGEEKSSGVPAP